MPTLLHGELFVYAVIGFAILSGVGTFLNRKREGQIKGGFVDFLTEVVLALVVGISVACVADSWDVERGVTCAAVLVLSNNGAESLVSIRKIVINQLRKLFQS
ncbi:phage holin family protein [Vibrio marisflavi]|uniref:Holin n=1 Tax=Vibrio marisflavi CECT 7928 TaxID=634439 RepID=A0ABM9A9L5_9VIBR|nr:phage holin family protein [Vibrio marisflavi]CAH0543092.1 hypothetical protein VMF7928_04396 [Vibrio marisflavi CECT 7928]